MMSHRHLSWMIFLLATAGSVGSSQAAESDLQHAATRAEEETPVVVYDQETLECLFQNDLGTMEMDLKVEGEWVMTEGVIVDQLSAEDTTREVAAQFQPASGYQHRMRFRPEGKGWSAWSGWTSGRIVRDIPVPGPGQSTAEELQAEMRTSQSSGTIGTHGYIRIKKLNSGG